MWRAGARVIEGYYIMSVPRLVFMRRGATLSGQGGCRLLGLGGKTGFSSE